MNALLVALSLVTVAAPPSAAQRLKTDYKAPLGLSWLCSLDEAKAVMAAKGFELSKEVPVSSGRDLGGEKVEVHFAGLFANMPSNTVLVLSDSGLTGVMVLVEGSPSQQWERIVGMMREAYGPPGKEVPPPKTASEAAASSYPDTKNKARIVELLGMAEGSRRDLLDEAIGSGEWKPHAEWAFKNAVVMVNTHGSQTVWGFLHRTLIDKAQQKPRDF